MSRAPHERVARRARLLAPLRRRRFARFGQGSALHRPRWIKHPQRIAIGDRVTILHGAWIAVEGSQNGPPAIVIGDDVAIRTDVTISAAVGVEIEDGVLIAGGVTIVDSDHTMGGDKPNPAFNPLVSAPIRIGARSWIAEKATILRGVTVGEGSVVAAHAVVREDVPPYSVVAGVPARIVGEVARTGA